MYQSEALSKGPENPRCVPQAVRTRRVHYIAGFDPRGARFYHKLYRSEAAKQSRLLGAKLEVGKRRKVAASVSGWTIRGNWGGDAVTTEYEFMGWDDIVRKNWQISLSKLLLRGFEFYLRCAINGCFTAIRKKSVKAFHAVMFPLLYFFLITTVWIISAGMLFRFLLEAGHELTGWAAIVAITFGVAWLGFWLAENIGLCWLFRATLFTYRWGARPFRDLESRIQEMADRIAAEQKRNPVDEVLIVGHSLGSMVAVAVTARILRAHLWEETPPDIHLLTVGQCIPYLSVIPSAERFRQDLLTLARDDRIPWTDASSAVDFMCFFKVDPIPSRNFIPAHADRPKQVSLRMFEMFSRDVYARMKKNQLRIHFQYLMASELPATYDYFAMTGGPIKLGARNL